MRAIILFAICLTVALSMLAGCATHPLPPAGLLTTKSLPGWLFCAENDDAGKCTIYRSAQPTAAEFQAMYDQLGLRSVVKLNGQLPFDGGPDIVPTDVTLFKRELLPAGPVDHEDVENVLNTLESAPKPVLLHCSHGIDRTGLILAIYRVRHGSWARAAWNEWLAYGHVDSWVFRILRDAFVRETGYDPTRP